MTGRERILAVFDGQKPDHLPCMPITMTFAADILGAKYLQTLLSGYKSNRFNWLPISPKSLSHSVS
jgi:hypothetical protein